MRQKYTKVKELIETIRERKSNGETNCEIAASLEPVLKPRTCAQNADVVN